MGLLQGRSGPPGGISPVIPSGPPSGAHSAAPARYPVKGSLRRFAPLTARAGVAPLRHEGGSGGNDRPGQFFELR